MNRRDEFDDPEGFQSAFGKIAEAMEHGHESLRSRGPLLGLLTAGVALFVLFAVLWSTYPHGGKGAADSGPVPTIRADATPFKITPDNPGGMDIPYQDSTVFAAMADRKSEGKVESLLPPAEKPIPRDQVFAGLKTDPIGMAGRDTPAPQPVQTPAQTASQTAPPQPAAQTVKTVAGTVVADSAPVILGPAEKSAATPADKAAKTEPAAGTPKAPAAKSAVQPKTEKSPGTYYIQLGSVKDRAATAALWKSLQKKYPDQLSGLTLRVQEANLGAKGTFYRIQAGTLAQDKAHSVCSAIAAKKGACLVVAR